MKVSSDSFEDEKDLFLVIYTSSSFLYKLPHYDCNVMQIRDTGNVTSWSSVFVTPQRKLHMWAHFEAIERYSQNIKVPKRDCVMKLLHAFVSSNFNYCPTTWHFTSKSSTMKIEKVHKAALRVVYNDYTTGYSGLLDMSNRTTLFLARLTSLLVEVFKCIRGLNPEFMNTIFVMDNKPYDTRSGSTSSQNPVKTTKYGIQSFAYQGAKCWNLLPANIKEIEELNELRRHVSQWNGPVCHYGCCVACIIKEL